MLFPLPVYYRRIESQRQSFQDIQRNFLEKFINFKKINFNQERARIILFIIILNAILPIMGSTELVQEGPLSPFQLDFGEKIFDYNSHTSEQNFARKEQGLSSVTRIIDQKDYTRVSLAKLMGFNECLLCRIMGDIQKHHEHRRSSIDNFKVATSDRTFPLSGISKEGVNTDISGKRRTFFKENFKSKLRSRVRRSAGDRRRRRLYSPLGKYILQIHPDGKVDGTLAPDSHLGIMITQTVSVGKVCIQSEATGLFLAMSPSGRLYGSPVYDPRRNAFEERLPDRKHVTYSIVTKKGLAYVGLSKRGKPKRGTKINSRNRSAHFLPLDRRN